MTSRRKTTPDLTGAVLLSCSLAGGACFRVGQRWCTLARSFGIQPLLFSVFEYG